MNSEVKNLGKNIEVRSHTRPIKIAYILPNGAHPHAQWILDAVFHESYTRWCGARTLIIPANADNSIDDRYKSWLEFFDPDFVYSYISIEKDLLNEINYLCLPITIKAHQTHQEPERWRDYTPSWGTYFKAVSSITTIHTPHGNYPLRRGSERFLPLVLTKYGDVQDKRFVTDNFGTAYDTHTYTNPIPQLYDTYSLVPEGLSANMFAGTETTTSLNDVLSMLAQQKLLTFAKLSMMHSEALPKIEPYQWSHTFNLFIGDSFLDRIHFWNSRHLTPSWTGLPGSLIVSKEFFDDEKFVEQLGLYFNNNNHLSLNNNSQGCITIKSQSIDQKELQQYQERLKKFTYNQIFLNADNFSKPALPESSDFKKAYKGGKAFKGFKISETENTIEAAEPEHFSYAPPRFIGLNKGNWAIDLEIDRHNNLSKFSNVTDVWQLPRKKSAARCFTKKLSKITSDHLLTVIPNSERHPFVDKGPRQVLTYDLNLPEDKTFFYFLATQNIEPNSDDLRHTKNSDEYQAIRVSDKGQNFRGVISMFESLSEAYELLTNRIWRIALRKFEKHPAIKFEQIFACIPNDNSYKNKLQNELRLERNKIQKYIDANFKDSLEYLVNRKIFFQIHHWRCNFCGHNNIRSIDEMKKQNHCEICNEQYFSPIDMTWSYKLNSFVTSSLCERNGLTVLWAIGFLHDGAFNRSFYYLPEVDLYPNYNNSENKEEIDFLCVKEGKFIAGEVKGSVFGFTRDDTAKTQVTDKIDKFTKKINNLKPDTALLVFEKYCENQNEIGAAKKELKEALERIKENANVKNLHVDAIVGDDVAQFRDYPIDYGVHGRRTVLVN